jgi:hypothetical protein
LEKEKIPNIEDIPPEASELLKEAMKTQENIGWYQWFRGRIFIQCRELYNHDIAYPPFPLYRLDGENK